MMTSDKCDFTPEAVITRISLEYTMFLHVIWYYMIFPRDLIKYTRRVHLIP